MRIVVFKVGLSVGYVMMIAGNLRWVVAVVPQALWNKLQLRVCGSSSFKLSEVKLLNSFLVVLKLSIITLMTHELYIIKLLRFQTELLSS